MREIPSYALGVASSWGPTIAVASLVLSLLAARGFETPEAIAGAGAPLMPAEPVDPGSMSKLVEQDYRVRIFDTLSVDGETYYYVNDHTFVQAHDGSWHLFGIFHREPARSGED